MKCPNCHAQIAWMEQPTPIGESRAIKEGDNFICAECSAVSVYQAGKLREMTAREFLSRSKASREVIKDLYTKSLLKKRVAPK